MLTRLRSAPLHSGVRACRFQNLATMRVPVPPLSRPVGAAVFRPRLSDRQWAAIAPHPRPAAPPAGRPPAVRRPGLSRRRSVGPPQAPAGRTCPRARTPGAVRRHLLAAAGRVAGGRVLRRDVDGVPRRTAARGRRSGPSWPWTAPTSRQKRGRGGRAVRPRDRHPGDARERGGRPAGPRRTHEAQRNEGALVAGVMGRAAAPPRPAGAKPVPLLACTTQLAGGPVDPRLRPGLPAAGQAGPAEARRHRRRWAVERTFASRRSGGCASATSGGRNSSR